MQGNEPEYTEVTTGRPGLSDSPLPTYKSYSGSSPQAAAFPELQVTATPTDSTANYYETPSWSSDQKAELLDSLEQPREATMVMTTQGPKMFAVSPVTGSPIYQSTARPWTTRTTGRSSGRQKVANNKRQKVSGGSGQRSTGTAQSYQQVGDQEQVTVSLVYETTPSPAVVTSSSIFQQIGGQVNVNISTPSDRAWQAAVTANPSLLQDPQDTATPPPSLTSLSTTLQPSSYYESASPVGPSWTERKDTVVEEEEGGIKEIWPQVTVTPRGAIPALRGTLATPRPSPPSPTPYYPSTPAPSFSVNTGIQWGRQKSGSRKEILQTLKANRKTWEKRRQNQKSSDQQEEQDTVDLSSELERLLPASTPSSPRPRPTPGPGAWTATARPPPAAITSPGWHIHSNPSLGSPSLTPATLAREDSVQLEPTLASRVKTRRKKNSHKKVKTIYKTKMKDGYKRAKNPRVYQFTSDDAISAASRRVEDQGGLDTSMAASQPQPSLASPGPGLSQHEVPRPRLKPLKKAGGWLLLGPQGASFHFDSLSQLLRLSENNFVPG